MSIKFYISILIALFLPLAPLSSRAECPNVVKWQEIARLGDIKAVALQVTKLSHMMDKAVECHGKEEDCETEPSLRAENLKALYRLYPAPIRTEHITELFVDRIRRRILPFVIPDGNCQVPDVQVFRTNERNDEAYLRNFMRQPDNLLISVQTAYLFPTGGEEQFGHQVFHIDDLIQRRGMPIIVLSMHIFKSDSFVTDRQGGVGEPYQTAISLEASESEIQKHIDRFLEHLVPALPTSSNGPPLQKLYENMMKKF